MNYKHICCLPKTVLRLKVQDTVSYKFHLAVLLNLKDIFHITFQANLSMSNMKNDILNNYSTEKSNQVYSHYKSLILYL
jgi:hypothetical protein